MSNFMLNAEWIPLGKTSTSSAVNYDKKMHYEFEGTPFHLDKVNFQSNLVAIAKYGGSIAITRDPRKAQLMVDGNKQLISIYSMAGERLTKFEWKNSGSPIHLGWTDLEKLIVVSSTGDVYLYTVNGRESSNFSLAAEFRNDVILEVQSWESGMVFLTRSEDTFRITVWVVLNINSDSPQVTQFGDVNSFIDPLLSETFNEDSNIPIEILTPYDQPAEILNLKVLIGFPDYKHLLLVDAVSCEEKGMNKGPYQKIAVSPRKDLIATFTETTGLSIFNSSLDSNSRDFNNASPLVPTQLCWCGQDCVCLYWDAEKIQKGNTSLILMYAPNKEYEKMMYEGSLRMETEIDGLRIISREGAEFLARVPKPIVSIFRIGSLDPSTALYDVYLHFQDHGLIQMKTIEKKCQDLGSTIQVIVDAAAHAWDIELQSDLLKAAAFGKSFPLCKTFDHEKFSRVCKSLRVLNCVRSEEVGIPLTFAEFRKLEPSGLISRLIHRHKHHLAFKICDYLGLRKEKTIVLEHWACSKVCTDDDDKAILEAIQRKLNKRENMSFAVVAHTAYRVGKKQLAIDLLQHETLAGEQVPLLLKLRQMDLALRKAIESGENDLIYLVILEMKKSMHIKDLIQTFENPKVTVARNLLITYCKEQDIDFLKIFFQVSDAPQDNTISMYQEAGNMDILQSFRETELGLRKKYLINAMDLFSQDKTLAEDTKAIENHIKLLQIQISLDKAIERCLFVGLSLSDTLFNCILIGTPQLMRKAISMKKEFKVSDKRFWWIQIRALAKSEKWDSLEKFCHAKKSPIGYRPFAEVCIQGGKSEEAKKYISLVTDTFEKVELYVLLQHWDAAIELASTSRNPSLMQHIIAMSSTSPEGPSIRAKIEAALQN